MMGICTMIWVKQLSGISSGSKARDPKLGTTIENIGILDQLLTK